MRRGFDGLAPMWRRRCAPDPYRGGVRVRSKRGDYVKILTWDGSGLCLFAKRLEKGRFVWPPIIEGAASDVGSTGAADRKERLAQNGCA